jgi:hypothetical protein
MQYHNDYYVNTKFSKLNSKSNNSSQRIVNSQKYTCGAVITNNYPQYYYR